VVEMRGELQAPRASQYEVNDDDSVVKLVAVKIAMPSETIWMLWVVTVGREEREIPVLCHVPVERIKGVDENG